MKDYNTMTNAELNKMLKEFTKILDGISPAEPKWDEAYKEYMTISAILDERFREESQADFNAFYEKHIKGKSWEEIIPENWDFYSDWHKDMYGYRPRKI